MYDYVLVMFVGVGIGTISTYLYCRYGKWKLSEIIDGADQVLHNKHFLSHLKANPDLKDKLGPLYDWLLEHGEPAEEKDDEDVAEVEKDTAEAAEPKTEKKKIKKTEKDDEAE